jgi:3-oxoacyl-[acyl-carrier protein] reductase
MNEEPCLAGRRVLITGASRGLGAELARAFWRAGADVAGVARTQGGLDRVRESLPAAGSQEFVPVAADLCDPDAPEQVWKAVTSRWSGLDVLVNNAGIQGPVGPVESNPWPEWELTLRVNLLAPVQLCRLFLPSLAKSGHGRVLGLSGGGATGPRANFSAYATAKVGLVRFCETLAEEVRDRGMTVNCIAPGAMGTDMLKQVLALGPEKAGARECQAAEKAMLAGDAIMRRAADLAVFLASDEAAGITGRLISAQWDPWPGLGRRAEALRESDIYTLRRIVPKDRGFDWNG